MAARATWKGFIKLSLVSVPVRGFTAHESGSEIRLNQLHAGCNARVKYSKRCPEHGELAANDIVSGYEYAKDQYVVIDPEEIARMRKQSDKAIAIVGFVGPDAVDPIYQSGKTYYLLPDGIAGNKPYALLRDGMQEGNVVAFTQVVFSGREQLALLRPDGELLVLSVLQYAAQVKEKDEFVAEVPREKLGKEELALARTLIDATRLEDFDIAAYKDDYVQRMKELIQLKIEGKEVVAAPEVEEPKIINLMEALKRSVAEAQAAAATGAPPQADASEKKMAPSETEPRKATAQRAARKRKSG
ncbi:MAG: Ku protein [Planctomycetota bacterium]